MTEETLKRESLGPTPGRSTLSFPYLTQWPTSGKEYERQCDRNGAGLGHAHA